MGGGLCGGGGGLSHYISPLPAPEMARDSNWEIILYNRKKRAGDSTKNLRRLKSLLKRMDNYTNKIDFASLLFSLP